MSAFTLVMCGLPAGIIPAVDRASKPLQKTRQHYSSSSVSSSWWRMDPSSSWAAADTESLYPTLAQQHLHPVLFGIVVASIFAAIMSTADSQLLVAASSIVRDGYQKVIHHDHDVPQANLVRYGQGVVTAFVVVSVIVGHLADELVFWLVLFAWAGLGAALGPASILALFWRRTTKAGVAAGLMATVIVSHLTKPPPHMDQLLDHTVNPAVKDPNVSGFTEGVRPLSYYKIMSSLALPHTSYALS